MEEHFQRHVDVLTDLCVLVLVVEFTNTVISNSKQPRRVSLTDLINRYENEENLLLLWFGTFRL